MLTDFLFGFLNDLLMSRPIYRPQFVHIVFPDGYQPTHLKCYRTAKAVERLRAYPVIAGVAFLDKQGKLYPWPHMVNAIGSKLSEGLIDASPAVQEPNLGFIAIRPDETNAWNAITAAYQQIGQRGLLPGSWQDVNADNLTRMHLARLQIHARNATSPAALNGTDAVSIFAMPDLPEA